MGKLQTLSKKDIKKLNAETGSDISPKSKVQMADDNFVLVDSVPTLFKYENKFLPTLKSLHINLPKVTIDMPAVPFMCKGADVMRPGIVELEDFESGDFVQVIDERNKRAICICRANQSSQEIKEAKSGKVLKNIHYVGDEIWYFSI